MVKAKFILSVLFIFVTTGIALADTPFNGTIECGELDAAFHITEIAFVASVRELPEKDVPPYFKGGRAFNANFEAVEPHLFGDSSAVKSSLKCGMQKKQQAATCHAPFAGEPGAPQLPGYVQIYVELPNPDFLLQKDAIHLASLTLRYFIPSNVTHQYYKTRQLYCGLRNNH